MAVPFFDVESVKKTPPGRTVAGLVWLLDWGVLGDFALLAAVTETGQAEAHQGEGGGFRNLPWVYCRYN